MIDRRPGGFTLIELVVVLVLIAMLATTAVLSLGPIIRQRQLNRGLEIISSNDGLARATARRLDQPVLITMDRKRKRIESKCASIHRQYRLPQRIEVIQTVGLDPLGRLSIDRNGQSPSYAVAVASGETTRWIVVAGGSGQVVTATSAREVGDLLGKQR